MEKSIKFSIKPDCIGKDGKMMAGLWKTVEDTLEVLIDYNYYKARAIAPGVFKENYEGSTNKTNDNWLGSELVIVDIDECRDINTILSKKMVQTFCFAAYPSSSYREDNHKYHLIFRLSEFVDNRRVYEEVASLIADRMGADTSMARAAQGLFGTQFAYGDWDKQDLLYINKNAKRIDHLKVMQEVVQKRDILEPLNHKEIAIKNAQHNNEYVSHRAQNHAEQTRDKQLKITLDALSYALKDWGRREYQDWLALIMSAYMGSSDYRVRDYIINHPDIDWGREGKNEFRRWWNIFQPKAGYTVATLFYYARQNGWLQYSDVEVDNYIEIDTDNLSEWLLEEDPKRAVIISQTGTGKTQACIDMIKAKGMPKTVLFAPSIKLCTALSERLTENGVKNTLYIEGAKTKDSETLIEANVLVTTLQTFAIKVMSKGVDIEEYELAFIDESDELISSFARANINSMGFTSHVNSKQSRWGFYTLFKVLSSVPHVIFMDGTATKVSVLVMNAFSPYPVEVYKNLYQKEKADVYLVQSLDDARKIAADYAIDGKRLVYAVDTRREADAFEQFLLLKGVDEDDIININANTHYSDNVREFFRDVEQGAKDYRIVIYNSAMGSGVSIEDTIPDAVVQVAFHLSPRNNLQILSRFRQQDKVFLYIPPSESLYSDDIEEKLSRIREAISLELNILNLTPVESDNIASVIEESAILSVSDILQQSRSKRDFYIRLLQDDNRKVYDINDVISNDEFRVSFKDALTVLKEQKEFIKNNWRSVPPIDRDNPPDASLSSEQVALGLLHAYINKTVPNNQNVEMSDYDLADMVISHGRHVYLLERWCEPEQALTKTLTDLLSKNRNRLTYNLYAARLELIGLVGLIFPNTDVELADEDIDPVRFLREIRLRKPIYNIMAGRRRNHYDEILAKEEDETSAALKISKYILKNIGLSVKRKNGPRLEDGSRSRVSYIDNVDDILTLVNLRGYVDIDSIEFSTERFYDIVRIMRNAVERFNNMSDAQQRRVINEVEEMQETFSEAVEYENVMF